MSQAAWTHPEADPGRTGWIDVAPVRALPSVRWRVDLARPTRLLATPAALAVEAAGGEDEVEALVLDPETGAVRWRVGGLARILAIRGQTLLVQEAGGAGRALDLATGDTRYAVAGKVLLALDDGVLVAQHEGVAWLAQPDPQAPPAAFPEWSARGMAGNMGWIASTELVVSATRSGAVALRKDDGRKAWDRPRARGWGLADRQVVLEATTEAGRETLVLEPDGSLATHLLRRRPLLLAPEALIAQDVAEGSLVRCDRASGAIVRLLPRWTVDEQRRRLAGARDVVYAAGVIELQALGPAGEVLWSLPPERFPETFEPVPADERLYVLLEAGLACLA